MRKSFRTWFTMFLATTCVPIARLAIQVRHKSLAPFYRHTSLVCTVLTRTMG